MINKLFPILIILLLGGILALPAVAAEEPPLTATQPQKYYLEAVPFVPQAPFGEWKDRRFQDGCEEATSLIAVAWAQKKSLTKTQIGRASCRERV